MPSRLYCGGCGISIFEKILAVRKHELQMGKKEPDCIGEDSVCIYACGLCVVYVVGAIGN